MYTPYEKIEKSKIEKFDEKFYFFFAKNVM